MSVIDLLDNIEESKKKRQKSGQSIGPELEKLPQPSKPKAAPVLKPEEEALPISEKILLGIPTGETIRTPVGPQPGDLDYKEPFGYSLVEKAKKVLGFSEPISEVEANRARTYFYNELVTQREKEKKENKAPSEMLYILKDSFSPFKLLNLASNGAVYTQAEKQVAQEFQQEHPYLSIIPQLVGNLGDLLLIGKAGGGFGLEAKTTTVAGGLSRLAPTATRMVGKGLESGSIFGIQSLVAETLNQLQAQKFEPGKLAKETAKGVGVGVSLGAAGALPKISQRAIAAGGTLAGWSTLEAFIEDRKIDEQDLSNIALNALIGMGFELLGGRTKSKMFRAEEIRSISEEQIIIRIMNTTGVSRAEASKLAILVEKLPQAFADKVIERSITQFEGVPKNYFEWQKDLKADYFKSVVNQVSQGKQIPEAIQTTNNIFGFGVKPVSAEIPVAAPPVTPIPGKPAPTLEDAEKIIAGIEKTERPKVPVDIRTEQEIMIFEDEQRKLINNAQTGVPITLQGYSGIREGRDSGFRSPEISYAQGYADMKQGEVAPKFTDKLENPFAVENKLEVMDYLRGKYPEETKRIEQEVKKKEEAYYQETGKRASTPATEEERDRFIKQKLSEEGFDGVIYKGFRPQEYQVFKISEPKKETEKEIEKEPEKKPVKSRKQVDIEFEARMKAIGDAQKEYEEKYPTFESKDINTDYTKAINEILVAQKGDYIVDRDGRLNVITAGNERYFQAAGYADKINRGYVRSRLFNAPAEVFGEAPDGLESANQIRQATADELKQVGVDPSLAKPDVFLTEEEYLKDGKIEKIVPETQEEKVAEAIKEKPKKIKEVAEETDILEPNVRRILGVGVKEGKFERVDKGVYVLRKGEKQLAYIETGDAVEVLPRLAQEGFKADMIFLDIPYKTPAVIGGNRGIKYEYITPEQFKIVVDAVKDITRYTETPVFYMFSQAKSGEKEMQRYTDVILDAGFKPVARGEYTKLQMDGITRVRNMRGNIIEPEGIILFTKLGVTNLVNPDLNFKLVRPKGYQTEKPAEMIRALIEMSTEEGDVILDPFAGSGVVPAEAIKAGRKAVAIEKSEKAVEEFIKPRVEAAAQKIVVDGSIPEQLIPKGKISFKRSLGNQIGVTQDSWGSVFWQIKGELPEEIKNLGIEVREYKDKSIETFSENPNIPAEFVETAQLTNITPENRPGNIVGVQGESVEKFYLNKKYLDPVIKAHPKAKGFLDEEKSIVVLKENGKIVGVVMGMIRLEEGDIKDIVPLTKGAEEGKIISDEGLIPKQRIGGGREEVKPEELPGALPMGEEEPGYLAREAGRISEEDISRGSRQRSAGIGKRLGTLSINKQIEELVKEKGDDLSLYSKEDKELLKQYTGAGGLEQVGAEGRGLLDEYFTPSEVVDLTWKLVGEYTDLEKPLLNILEPSVGIGSFIFDQKQKGYITGYELNKTSSIIAQILMPGAEIHNEPFESVFMDDRGNKKDFNADYDLVIGNPPYGEHRGKYKGLGELPSIKKYEEYFLTRAIDLLKQDGIAAMVFPSGFLRSSTANTAKQRIAKDADIVDARRLPNGTFAFTDIGTDILVLQKGKTVNEDTKLWQTRLDLMSNDNYFKQFPENIMGEEKERSGKFGPERYVEGSLSGMAQEVKVHEAEEEVPNEGKLTDGKEENLNKIDGEVDPGDGMAQTDEKDLAELNKKVVIISNKQDKTIQIKNTNVSPEEEKIWKSVLATGELSAEVPTGLKVNYYQGKWYNDFNYLQGNIYEKLERLEKDKEFINEAQYSKQKKALQDILPTPQKLENITLTPNSDFVKDYIKFDDESLAQLFRDYIRELPYGAFKNSSQWEVSNYIDGSVVNAGDKILNAEIRRRRRLVGNELFKRFINEELTEDQRKVLVDVYNKTFNSTYQPNYSNVPVSAPVNSTFKGDVLRPHPHQIKGIGFLTNKGVGSLAWDVGWGKTMAAIMSVNEVLHKGWAKRPLLVVPNGTYQNWITELKEIIPNVKINSLVNLGGKFKGNLKTLEIPEGTISVLTYDGMKKLGFKEETYQRLLVDLQDVMANVNTTKRGEAKEKEKVSEAIGRAAKKTTADRYFEDLGFDFVVIDEVHNFKNIFAGAKITKGGNEFRNVRGSTSDRGIKAYLMTQYVLGQNNGRGVVTLSATPFTNSPLEIYSILSLLAKKRLEDIKIKNVNDFMNMFMKLDPRLQVKADRTVKDEDVIESFYNLQQLQKLISEYIDFRSGETEGFIRPDKTKRKVVLKPTETQMDYLDKAQALFNDKDAGGAIVAITEQQNTTLSPYLSRFNQLSYPSYKEFVENSPKIKQAMEVIRQVKKDKPGVGQVIYMPRGIEFYPLLKQYLIKEINYKPNQVGIIAGGMSIDAKQSVQDGFNAEKIKIVIGSEAIKEGINLQQNTTELHHLHLPWNPTDLLQVEGRIWRQNNQWRNVRIHYYLIENSIDQFIFQKLETKEKRIKNIWSYSGNEIEVGDLNFEDMKLDLITDPVVKLNAEEAFAKAKEQREIDTLRSEVAFLERKIQRVADLEDSLKDVEDDLSEENIEKLKSWNYDEKEIADVIKKAKSKKLRIQKELSVAKQKLHEVDVAEVKSQIEQKNKDIEAKEENQQNIRDKYEKLREKAAETRVETIVQLNDYERYPAQIEEENKTFFMKAKKRLPVSLAEKAPPSGYASIGMYNDQDEIKLGSFDKIRPIEFPELVGLARELSGKVPVISKYMGKALGRFYEKDAKIKLWKDLFKPENINQLTRTLAHEIGHLTDYLPDGVLKRGNLLARLLTLKRYLRNRFGDVEITNKEIRKELQGVSEYWRPYDASQVSASYIKYRNSAVELYADAISMLFNNPGLLEEKAPVFYDGFFKFLDEKPEVKTAYFDLQEILAQDRETLIALRRERTKEMFSRADYKSKELQKITEERRKLNLRSFWDKFSYGIRSLNQPVYNRVNELQKKGVFIPDDFNPKYLLSGKNYLSGRIKALFEKNVQPIMEDLNRNDIGWKTFGEFLFYERIVAGDRSEFANPGGITPTAAQELINSIQKELGNERYDVLERNADSFRFFLKDLVGQAHNVGMITPEMFAKTQENLKYVPFQVVEYMENYVGWKTKVQVGTLKDVSNPANALLLKSISTIRAIENQKVRIATFQLLQKNFPNEIKEAETQFTGKAQRPIPSRDPDFELVTYYKDGKLKGKYVDPYIAKSLDNDTIASNRAVMIILSPIRWLNQKLFRPLFVIYNPGWIPFNFIRDFMRFWKNTPDLSLVRAVKRYGQAIRAAKVRAFGISKEASDADLEARELIRKMEEEEILSVTWNDVLSGQSDEDAQIERIMQDVGLAESKKEVLTLLKPVYSFLNKSGILPLLRTIKKVGDFTETLPKVAGYYELEGKMPPQKMREFIRKNIGSPDFFEKGYLTPATNNIFLFSNAFVQAVSSDAYIATNPRTRSGFWFKTGKTVFLLKILMFAALAGAFGKKVKDMMGDASEYDLTNYFVIPIGKDSKNGKTTYLRIPMDETSRLLGGVLWKTMRGTSNNQPFGKDIADVASLFGGQLPGLTPAISAPLSALDFAQGNNPYDSFRGRPVLSDEQFAAGGTYALKPFLLWEFQQMGGNIFTKFYIGEQTPTEQTLGEKFLSTPFLSNVVGRFVRVSDYGQIEQYRQITGQVKQKAAAQRIEETKLINDYVKKYQDKKDTMLELSNDLVVEALGHEPVGSEEKSKAKRLKKKFEIATIKGKADPMINSIISAVSNEEKLTLLRVFKETIKDDEFQALKAELIKYKLADPKLFKKLK